MPRCLMPGMITSLGLLLCQEELTFFQNDKVKSETQNVA